MISRAEHIIRPSSCGSKVHVIQTVVVNGTRVDVGTVFVAKGSDALGQAQKYVGERIVGLTLVDGKLVDSNLAAQFRRAEAEVSATGGL